MSIASAEKTALGSGVVIISTPAGAVFSAEYSEASWDETVEIIKIKGNDTYPKATFDGPEECKGKFKINVRDSKLMAAVHGVSATGSTFHKAEFVVTGTSVSSSAGAFVGARNANGKSLQVTTGSAVAGVSLTFATGTGSGTLAAGEAFPVTLAVAVADSRADGWAESVRSMGNDFRYDILFLTEASNFYGGREFYSAKIPKISTALKVGAVIENDIDFEAFPHPTTGKVHGEV